MKLFVSLSFDDGWKSAIMSAYPLLEKYRMPATFYIISDRLTDEHSEYMSPEDLRVLASHDHELGVHTRSHKHLPDLDDKELGYEINQGLDDLLVLGFKPRTFAYPYGDWNPHVVKQVREAGFFAARSIERGMNDERTNHLLLRGNGVREDHTADDVKGWIREAAKTGGWLILYFHQIEQAEVLRERKWIYGTTPQVLEEVLRFLQSEQIPTMTVEKGMEHLLAV
ncbi:MAG: polysaccharide deacetylase family protein [Patescibacteria group bacterium]